MKKRKITSEILYGRWPEMKQHLDRINFGASTRAEAKKRLLARIKGLKDYLATYLDSSSRTPSPQ